MRELTKVQSKIFLAGAILMVLGAVTSIFQFDFSPYIYSVGAIAYVSMQLLQRYEGKNQTLRRLRFILILSGFILLFTGVMMFANRSNYFGLSQINYLTYIHQKWVVTLLIGALLQAYCSVRIPNELDKEAKKL